MLNKTRQREATSVLHVKAGARVSDEIEHSLGWIRQILCHSTQHNIEAWNIAYNGSRCTVIENMLLAKMQETKPCNVQL